MGGIVFGLIILIPSFAISLGGTASFSQIFMVPSFLIFILWIFSFVKRLEIPLHSCLSNRGPFNDGSFVCISFSMNWWAGSSFPSGKPTRIG